MSVKVYKFNARPEEELQVGPEVYHGGDTVELDESLAVDPRLSEVGDAPEAAEAGDDKGASSDTPAEPAKPGATFPASSGGKGK